MLNALAIIAAVVDLGLIAWLLFLKNDMKRTIGDYSALMDRHTSVLLEKAKAETDRAAAQQLVDTLKAKNMELERVKTKLEKQLADAAAANPVLEISSKPRAFKPWSK